MEGSSNSATVDSTAFNATLEDFALASRRARSRIYPGEALSASKYYLVEPLLKGEQGIPVGDLATAAGVTPATASRLFDSLADEGLVHRVRDQADRRVVRIALTPHGSRVVTGQRRRIVARRQRIFELLEPSERATAARLLSRLAALYEDLR